MWIYIFAPILGGLLASLFHWKTVTFRRKMKYDRDIENKRLKQINKLSREKKNKNSDDENEDSDYSSSNESYKAT